MTTSIKVIEELRNAAKTHTLLELAAMFGKSRSAMNMLCYSRGIKYQRQPYNVSKHVIAARRKAGDERLNNPATNAEIRNQQLATLSYKENMESLHRLATRCKTQIYYRPWR